MIESIQSLREKAKSKIQSSKTIEQLESLRVEFLGKKGEITLLLKGLKELDLDMRKEVGREANLLKEELAELIAHKQAELRESSLRKSIGIQQDFDFTLPGTYYPTGSLSPVTIVQKEIEKIFTGMGFNIVDGPEAEDDYHNFAALNFTEHHPARDMQDTYWLENGDLLRTHTSPCQVRAMKKYGAPLRVIAPGRCFRNENIDASHENTFFQVEGMMIDRNISIANLIYTMKLLLTKVFNKDELKIRLRPGYFPFVEPGFELDLNCLICGGSGCPTCKHSGWIEMLPCGMVHPNVLKYSGIDPEVFTGFAFGLGLTRLAMMKYGIKDIRVMNSGDLRSLRQVATR